MKTNSFPGLNKNHGFLVKIQEQQFSNSENERNIKQTQRRKARQVRFSGEVLAGSSPDNEVKNMGKSYTVSAPSGDFEINDGEIDIKSFSSGHRDQIMQAIEDPREMMTKFLCEVAGMVISRAYEDSQYELSAAKILYFIALKEEIMYKGTNNPDYAFRYTIIEVLNGLLDPASCLDLRTTDQQSWVSLNRFLSHMYSLFVFSEQKMAELGVCVLKALSVLTKVPCVNDFDEVEILSCIMFDHGKYLHFTNPSRMAEVVKNIRDSFLSSAVDDCCRRMLLPLIELQAGNWALSTDAQKYYFEK